MSIKAKLSTCIKKLEEARKACEALNALEQDTNTDNSEPQFFCAFDTGKKSHLAGYGTMFETFIETQQLKCYSGEGTTPVSATDPKHRKALLQIEVCQAKVGKRKRTNSSGSLLNLDPNFSSVHFPTF